MREGVVHQIGDIGGVDVSEAEQTSREVRGVVVRTEHTTELWVKHCLYFIPVIDNTSPTMEACKQNTQALFTANQSQ